MKMVPLKYRIATRGGSRRVAGLAVRAPKDLPAWVRICVRETLPGHWLAEHYDSGRFIAFTSAPSATIAAGRAWSALANRSFGERNLAKLRELSEGAS